MHCVFAQHSDMKYTCDDCDRKYTPKNIKDIFDSDLINRLVLYDKEMESFAMLIYYMVFDISASNTLCCRKNLVQYVHKYFYKYHKLSIDAIMKASPENDHDRAYHDKLVMILRHNDSHITTQ